MIFLCLFGLFFFICTAEPMPESPGPTIITSLLIAVSGVLFIPYAFLFFASYGLSALATRPQVQIALSQQQFADAMRLV